MKNFKKILFSAAFALTLAGCTSNPVMNIQERSIPDRLDGSAQTQDTIKKSIIAGCIARNWTCREVAPGQIIASINVRKHHAEADIKYDIDNYSITYKDSDLLDYNEKYYTIHRNYNRWVRNLNDAIIKQLSI
ncbi:hypothetical protein MJO52_00470 [Microbulbifer variabilis]|uniref:Lipoprotein n=1 Tax=Microbulbifer variabilis TaxID=266805 RepID=A0ABY4VBJ9_9GAMM|nr:hypothetical protein [Microbulbifer variabilis]USD21648.1 hypothetical protein MJO52_00470 [Microbulbifer variabilis]